MLRKALLVGVNDYAPIGPGGPDLRGCVPDVRDMAHTLNALNIVPATPASMKILTDSRATRDNILAGLKWLTKGAKKGDTLIFHYSGHGTQVADISGDEMIDHRDEAICPHDFATAGVITDDDVRRALSGVSPGVNLDVLLDSCFSGTGTRELRGRLMVTDPEMEEETVVMATSRYVEPPIDYGYFLEAEPWIPKRGIMRVPTEERAEERQVVVVPGLNHVLWAGCRDNQTSAESSVGGVYRGIFTYCFCRVLRRAGIGITRRRLDALVSADIAAMGYSQVPQLEATVISIAEKVFT